MVVRCWEGGARGIHMSFIYIYIYHTKLGAKELLGASQLHDSDDVNVFHVLRSFSLKGKCHDVINYFCMI